MTNDATSKDSIKIKMDTYTKQLYEDFIRALSDRIRETAGSAVSQLKLISKVLNALRDQVQESKEVQIKEIEEILNQLNLLTENDNKLLADISQAINTHKSEIQASINSGQDHLINYFNTLNDLIGGVSKEVKLTPDVINDNMNKSLTLLKERLNNDLSSITKGNCDSATNLVNEHIYSEANILTNTLSGNIQSIESTIKYLQEDLHSELAQGNDRIEIRISKSLRIASVCVRRIQFTEQLIYTSLKTHIGSFLEYRLYSEDKFSGIESCILEQKAISQHLYDLNSQINSEISMLKKYVVTGDHASISDLINTSISKAGDQIEESINRTTQVIENYYPDLRKFVGQENQEHATRVIDELARRLESFRDVILQSISKSESNAIERINIVCKELTDKIDTSTSVFSDHHNELLQTLNGLHEELKSRHQDLCDMNDKLTEQVNTNQELLIWIITPWYKKIFGRKHGKPQVLAKKPAVESEDN